jgi:hypothetical protein
VRSSPCIHCAIPGIPSHWLWFQQKWIVGATLDDPVHFNESGLFDGVTKAFYGFFTKEELKKFEKSARSLYWNSRSSVRSEYPKSRTSKGFTSCTLKMANKTVGSLLSVALTVQDNRVFDMMDDVSKKQQQCYHTFPVTVAPKRTCKKRKKETKLSQKVKDSSMLVATYMKLLEHFPSHHNYTASHLYVTQTCHNHNFIPRYPKQ